MDSQRGRVNDTARFGFLPHPLSPSPETGEGELTSGFVAQLLGAHEGVAFEDSENGLRSAVGARLKTIVAPNAYTRNHDFTGAVLVVEDLAGVDLGVVRRLC